MATQSPFFGKREREAEPLASRPAPLMGSGTNLSGSPVTPANLSAQSTASAAAKEGGSKLTVSNPSNPASDWSYVTMFDGVSTRSDELSASIPSCATPVSHDFGCHVVLLPAMNRFTSCWFDTK